jgi:hypothetical protein
MEAVMYQRTKSRLNGNLNEIGRKFHDAIPLDDIFRAIAPGGLQPVDEDGEPWQGILCGQTGSAKFELLEWVVAHTSFGASRQPRRCDFVLVLDWWRHDTGRYEVNCYLS